jgi:hypothetical protein|tara:strand:+ start:882 stop:2297 length:1416 start_codon:yes stop_codon:yes gene_type:complete
MAENATYTLLVDLNQGVEIGKADLSSANAPASQINLLNKLPQPLSKLQSIEIVTYVFEDLASNEAMDLSTLSTAKLEGRLINSTDSAVALDSSLTISGGDNNIATAVVDKDIIPAAWTAGVVRLTWTFEDASTKCIFYQDQIFVDPAGTQNGTAVTGFIVKDATTTVQPTSNITFSTDGSVTDSGNNVATVRNDTTTNMSWEYDNTVAKADPGAGLFRGNHATVSSITELYIDDLDKAGIDMGGWLTNLSGGVNLRFGQTDDPTGGELFTVTSATDETGYWTLVVVHVASGTTGMADGKTFGLTMEGASSAPFTTTTVTASSSASVEFTVSTGSYQLIIEDSIPATDLQPLLLQVFIGSYQTSSYLTDRGWSNNNSTGGNRFTGSVRLSDGDGNLATEGCSGSVWFGELDSTTTYKKFVGTINMTGSANNYAQHIGGHYAGGTGAITKIRLIYSSGNIASGIFKLRSYGAN